MIFMLAFMQSQTLKTISEILTIKVRRSAVGSVSRMRSEIPRIQKSLQKYLGKSKGGGTDSTTDGKLGMYGLQEVENPRQAWAKSKIRFIIVTMMLESDLIACSNRSCNWRHSNFMPAMRSRYCKIGKSRRSSLGRQFVFVCPAKEQNEPFKQQSQWQVALTRSAKFGFAVSGLRRLRRPHFCRTASTAGQIWSCCVDAKLNNGILRSYSASSYPEIVPWPCQPLSVAKQH